MHRRLAVALSVCALSAVAAGAEPPALTLSAHLVIEDAPREFGGLSAIIVAKDGERAQILSDRGKLFDVALWRDQSQVLRQVAVLRAKYLYIYTPQHDVDSEGLARAPGGGVFVAVESPPSVLHYTPARSWPEPALPFPPLAIGNTNRGLEAVAMDPQGRLVTMPESPPDDEAGFPVYRLEDGTWRKVALLAKRGPFLVVGADFGPDGRLYVLERAVSALGFRSRIRRVALADEITQVETLFQSDLGQYDNLEGISLWRDDAGDVRITLVSDNNFLSIQRTEFVEFILRE